MCISSTGLNNLDTGNIMENGYFARSLVGSWRPLDSGPITLYQSLQMAMVQRLGIWTREVTSRVRASIPLCGLRSADDGNEEAARADELAWFYWSRSRAPELGMGGGGSHTGPPEGPVDPAVDRGSVLLRAEAAARSRDGPTAKLSYWANCYGY